MSMCVSTVKINHAGEMAENVYSVKSNSSDIWQGVWEVKLDH